MSFNFVEFLGVAPWQLLTAFAIVFVLDPIAYMNTARLKSVEQKDFNFVLYFSFCGLLILFLSLISNMVFGRTSAFLQYVAQAFWAIALVRMISVYKVHWYFAGPIALFLICGSIFNILEGVKIINVLDKIDLAMGFTPAEKPETTQLQDKGFLFGLRDKIYVKPSQILLYLWYFLNFVLPLHYFGTIYSLYKADRKDRARKEHIHNDALIKAITVFSIIFAAMIAFVLSGADIFQIGIVTAILGAGFSIAAKELISNFAAGIVLMWDNSIKRNDVITVEGLGYGWVDEISMRYTKIIDRNEMNILVPNLQLISTRIENWTQNNNLVRLKLDIEVAYGTNLKQALEIMMDCCYHVPRVLQQPRRPNALVFATGDSGIKLQLRFWIKDPKNGIRNVMSDVYLYVLDKFSQALPRIEIPYNQLEVRRVLPDIERKPT